MSRWRFAGIHPPAQKQAAGVAIRRMPTPENLWLMLQQHQGELALPTVKVGQFVHRGECLAKPDGRGAAVHAPIAGRIQSVQERSVVGGHGWCIELQRAATAADDAWWSDEQVDDSELSPEDVLARIEAAGIVGLGGAGFPTAEKLRERPMQALILNGAECEPAISCDDRLMRERAASIVQGAQILRRLLQPARTIIAIEDDKPEAIAAINTALDDTGIELQVLAARYPSGAQKQLIRQLLGVDIAQGWHSTDYGISLINIATAEAIARALTRSEPLIRRVITVTGDAVAQAGNYDVAIGTPIRALLAFAQTDFSVLGRVIMGGPLMGVAVDNLDAPVSKLSNCFVAEKLTSVGAALARECIRCGDCEAVCPAQLQPQQLYWFLRSSQIDRARQYGLNACIECGACAWVCPSQLSLVQHYRLGKQQLRQDDTLARERENTAQRVTARHARLTAQESEHARKLLPLETETTPLPPLQQPAATPQEPEAGVALSDVLAAAARARAKKQSAPEREHD